MNVVASNEAAMPLSSAAAEDYDDGLPSYEMAIQMESLSHQSHQQATTVLENVRENIFIEAEKPKGFFQIGYKEFGTLAVTIFCSVLLRILNIRFVTILTALELVNGFVAIFQIMCIISGIRNYQDRMEMPYTFSIIGVQCLLSIGLISLKIAYEINISN